MKTNEGLTMQGMRMIETMKKVIMLTYDEETYEDKDLTRQWMRTEVSLYMTMVEVNNINLRLNATLIGACYNEVSEVVLTAGRCIDNIRGS